MSPHRVQLSRKKGWRKPENTVVVARPSKWGNPYRVGGEVTAARAVSNFADLIERCSAKTTDPLLEHDGLGVWDRNIRSNIVSALGGQNLACWCPLDQPCHADVLLELANEVTS